jgi:hypothetical protein
MARTRRDLDPHGLAARVRQQLKREPAGWRRERLLAVKLGLEGQLGLEEIAAHLGSGPLLRPGLVRSVPPRGLGRAASAAPAGPGASVPAVARAVAPKPWAKSWRRAPCRRAADAQRWLREEGGLPVKLVTLYKCLKKAGARLKVPRPCHEKKDVWASEAFREALAVHLAALALPPDRPVRLWVADEMRYGLLPVTPGAGCGV